MTLPRSSPRKARLLETRSAFLKKWKCDVPLLHEYFKVYVSFLLLFEKKTVAEIAEALSFIEEIDGLDKILFLRILAAACRHRVRVLRDPKWESAITEGVRKKVKSEVKFMQAKKKEILRAIETLSDRLQGMIQNRKRLQESPSPEDVALLDGLERFKQAVGHKGKYRFLAQSRRYNELMRRPPKALVVFLLENVSQRRTISNDFLKALGAFVLTWGFEKRHASDELPLDVGQRLRQRYRAYEHKVSFLLSGKSYDIALI